MRSIKTLKLIGKISVKRLEPEEVLFEKLGGMEFWRLAISYGPYGEPNLNRIEEQLKDELKKIER